MGLFLKYIDFGTTGASNILPDELTSIVAGFRIHNNKNGITSI